MHFLPFQSLIKLESLWWHFATMRIHYDFKIIGREQPWLRVKAMALRPANVGSAPVSTHTSHWWWQEEHQAKIAATIP